MPKKHVITADPFKRFTEAGRVYYYARIHVALGWPVDTRIPKQLYDELMAARCSDESPARRRSRGRSNPSTAR